MRKVAITLLLVAGVCMATTKASAEEMNDGKKAVPETAIDFGNGRWAPPDPVVYYGYGRRSEPPSLTGPYVSAHIGGTEMNDFDFGPYHSYGYDTPGITMLGAVGFGFKNNCRLEGEVGYQINGNNGDYENRNVSALSFLANGYYDIPVSGRFRPYITAGAGIANVKADGPSILVPTNQTAFAWQVGAGLIVPLGGTIKLDVRYRYFATNVALDTIFSNYRLSSNSALIGLIFGI